MQKTMTTFTQKEMKTEPKQSTPPLPATAWAETEWHTLETDVTLKQLAVDSNSGLTTAEAQRRLQQVGANELLDKGIKSPWRILWEQLTAIMMVVLIAAAGIKAALGEYIDAGAILAIVVLNAALGVFQEYRAERAMAELKKMAAPLVRVRRDGKVQEVPARDLVPGDMIQVEAGSIVPADARLVQSANLRVQEASLTGESVPVEKTPQAVPNPHAPLGDRHNMLYFGTAVSYGRGTAVVTGTGMTTELGKIATMIQDVSNDATPLQKRIHSLGVFLAVACLVVVALVIGAGVVNGRPIVDMFLAGVAIAVAAIPEGLPAVLTITLALGAQRMLKRRALIRKLPAVETLGSVTVICSDKTGTLTENRMTVTMLDVAGHTLDLKEVVREGQPTLIEGTRVLEPGDSAQRWLLAGSALCNDAILQRDTQDPTRFVAVGDPTEGALVVAAAQFGLWREPLEAALPRVGEVPFSSERKRMTTVHRLPEQLPDGLAPLGAWVNDHEYIAFTKGSVDGLVRLSDYVWANERLEPMTPEWQARIEQANADLAQNGLRVLGVGWRAFEYLPTEINEATVEQGMVFVGMVGMMDPPRPEVRDAVATAKAAGIRPVMITGDHPMTALQIAKELHIASDDGRVLTGQELAQMTPAQLQRAVGEVSVYARVAPEHKLQIVEALQQQGHIVAMTGDGVNDAPALRRADIGVAMGITGTDVSKEAADMVLTDDNFATIVGAVEEGRTIYDNVRKFVKYIVTSNTGEVLVMFLSQLLGMPLPMTTLQILWMNLVTDGVPGLALGLEPTEKNTMHRAPHAPKESIFSRGLGRHVLTIGPVLALVAFGVGYFAYMNNNPAWGTMVFVTLTLSQLGHALAVRSNRESLFKIGVRSNPLLLGAVLLTLVLQMMVVYLPPFQQFFETVPLTLNDLALCLVASTVVFWAVEIEKWLVRRGILA
jgi:P-type Ca2+ transporter type 2C